MGYQPLPTIGFDKYTYWNLLTDTPTGRTYGAAKSLLGNVSVEPTDTANTETFDADNVAYASFPYIENEGHTLTGADITPEVYADFTGVSLDESGGYEPDRGNTPQFAVAWRLMKSDKTFRYVRYNKGIFSTPPNVGGTTKPSQGAPTFGTATVTYKALDTIFGKKYYFIDESAILALGLTIEEFEAEFFNDPNYKPAANLAPSVNAPDAATLSAGGVLTYSVKLGNGTLKATSAAISSGDTDVAIVAPPSLAVNGNITVVGIGAGSANVTITFNDTNNTTKTIGVTVN
ncbi:hypothetical protein AGMMS49975_15050 [Clostridia bacterium]|nr:hypothetical protein AGMMS49975_15050 [Clostridia bacterium]